MSNQRKSEILNSKSETNSNDQNTKFKTKKAQIYPPSAPKLKTHLPAAVRTPALASQEAAGAIRIPQQKRLQTLGFISTKFLNFFPFLHKRDKICPVFA